LLGELPQQNAPRGHESHRFVELADRPHNMQLSQMLFGFRSQQKCIASGEQEFIDQGVGVLG
jgi:hypothetical protein